jgi:PAS domain S-box-containing protein
MMDKQTTNQHQDTILDSINEGVFTINLDWQITAFNRAAEDITGINRINALGHPCCEVFRASICESSCALRCTLASGEPVVNATAYIVNEAGQRIPIRLSTALLKNENGKVVGGVETFQDLTQVEQLQKELELRYTFEDIIGRSRAMLDLFQLLPQIADSPSTVLIEGSSGTGKEMVARAIHNISPRRKKRFIAVNCGALPDTLLESELFGYKAGAFTDAKKDKKGRFALADGGTIFLDEIGDISPAMQIRLLRVLQERCFEPLGSVEPVHVDVHVLAATNKDLIQLVEAGIFRKDLFYRIRVVHIALPSLNQRREDIPLLIDHFIAKFNRLQERSIAEVSEDVIACLMDHDFPGNVRELENIIEQAFVLCRSGVIDMEHLPAEFRSSESDVGTPIHGIKLLKTMEKYMINEAIRRNNGNRIRAAKDLGINPSTLYRKIQSLNIEIPQTDGRSK